MTNWDVKFLETAQHIAGWSKDPSSKVGAVFVRDRQILSTGYNGFPKGIEDSEQRLTNREEKYKYVVHAEMNAIYNAGKIGVSLQGSDLYVSTLPVCSECAKGIIQVGTKRVFMQLSALGVERWAASFSLTRELLEEAGVQIVFI